MAVPVNPLPLKIKIKTSAGQNQGAKTQSNRQTVERSYSGFVFVFWIFFFLFFLWWWWGGEGAAGVLDRDAYIAIHRHKLCKNNIKLLYLDRISCLKKRFLPYHYHLHQYHHHYHLHCHYHHLCYLHYFRCYCCCGCYYSFPIIMWAKYKRKGMTANRLLC